MMKRREFAGVIGAGLLFPQNLLKGMICEPEDTSVAVELDLNDHWRRMVPKKVLIVSFGNDEHPVREEYVRFIKGHNAAKTADDFLSGHLGIGEWVVPRTYELVTTEHLVLGIGSKHRPVPEYLDFRNEVFQQLGRGKDIIVTPHAIRAYTMPEITCGTERHPFPLVLHFDHPIITEHLSRQFRKSYPQRHWDKSQWEAWESQQRMNMAIAVGR